MAPYPARLFQEMLLIRACLGQFKQKGEQKAIACEIAFHEKAGRSQGNFGFMLLRSVFHSPAEWPLTPCFHSHSRGAIRSLGAGWAFSIQPVLLSD